MPEYNAPGPYIEELAGGPAPIQGVATSILALVGWTEKGLVNEPTLISGMAEFLRLFGNYISAGLIPTIAHAFFKNGGMYAYINRVVGSGATAGVAYLTEPVANEDSGDDGDNATLTFSWEAAETPIEPASWTHSHWRRGTPVAGATAVSTAPDGAIVIWKTSGAGAGEGTFVTPTLADGLEPGSVTIDWVSGTVAKSMTDDGEGGFTGDGNAAGSTINYLTGAIVFDATGDIPDAGLVSTITNDYTPMEQETDGVASAAGVISGTNIASGTIDATTGEISITYTVAPSAVYPTAAASVAQSLLYSYEQVLWQIDMRWEGVKGNDYRITVEGAAGWENDATGTFDRWTVRLWEADANDNYSNIETYAELDFTTSTSAQFFPTVVNDTVNGSKNISVTDVGNTGVPSSLYGSAVTDEDTGEDGDGTTTEFTFTLEEASCWPTTLTISCDGDEITDDGDGNLTGDGTGTIDYDTGEVEATFTAAPGVDSILATYYTGATYDEDAPLTEDMTGGADGSAVTSSEITAAALEAADEGIYALNNVEDDLLVSIPDFAGDEDVDGALLDFCEAKKDRFAILTTPVGTTYTSAVNYKKRTLNKNNNSYGAIYWPWVQVTDPVTNRPAYIPPMGHVAGRYAYTDQNENVGKAPAGPDDGALKWCTGLEKSPTKAQVGHLYKNRVNPLVDWPAVGNRAIWGARTLQVNGEFGNIQARRLFMFLEKSIYNAVYTHVFENNNANLRTGIKLQLDSFMLRLTNNGYFESKVPTEAFQVVCDESNNPAEDVALGILAVDIYAAPNKPAEFLPLRFRQMLAQ